MTLSPAAWGAFDTAVRVFVAWQVVWGLAAFVSVWRDKVLASGGRRRISERTLHHTEAWGGWLGSLVAQQVFQHKTHKTSYQRTFQVIAVLWLMAWAAVVGLTARARSVEGGDLQLIWSEQSESPRSTPVGVEYKGVLLTLQQNGIPLSESTHQPDYLKMPAI
ncbi:DUF1294 domain-containing protein [Deinococcus sp.]|uniref:DUF1294 domain-containing protein n=1 Tax=Deinococcus sp. TaxID=47478 RepID=UPI002869CCAD|nr:DUF1294 domain-containing protein [Deinococcus sp.]